MIIPLSALHKNDHIQIKIYLLNTGKENYIYLSLCLPVY